MDSLGDFIISYIPDGPGKDAEQRVVDAVKPIVSKRQGIGYWHFPLVDRRNNVRETDILILDPEWGVVVVEVKGIDISYMEGISGYQWFLKKPYYGETRMNPYEQARQQAQVIRERLKEHGPEELKRVPVRVLVALPYITRSEWEMGGYDFLLSDTPILFGDELGPQALQRRIDGAPIEGRARPLDDDAFQKLLQVFGMQRPRAQKLQDTSPAPTEAARRKADVLEEIENHVRRYDVQQEKIAKSIPPGPQRIRGIAGSGKTVLLAQKAANMHLLHPDWKIALVFFSKSLYTQIKKEVDHWLQLGSNGQVRLTDPEVRRKLLVLHAWGGSHEEGLYTYLAKQVDAEVLDVNAVRLRDRRISPTQGVIYCAKALLEYAEQQGESLEEFDAILIDEGQDLVAAKEQLSFEEKQAYYWLAYQALKPVEQPQTLFDDVRKPETKRLIWAYDEAQSLDSLVIPKADVLFGRNGPVDVSGAYPGNILRSEIMRRCYRTPGPVLMTAHALGMGWLRPEGSVAWISDRRDWDRIGYKVDGGTLRPGQTITITRPLENSPHPLTNSEERLITFQNHPTDLQEAESVARAIKFNIEQEGVDPHRIMVVCLGKYSNNLIDRVYNALRQHGIDTLVSGNRYRNTKRAGNTYEERGLRKGDNFRENGCVTVTGIHRAKGNEADIVYVVGLEEVGKADYDASLRNQLFVGISRSRGWVHLSGSNVTPKFVGEVEAVLAAPHNITFTVKPPQRAPRVLDDE